MTDTLRDALATKLDELINTNIRYRADGSFQINYAAVASRLLEGGPGEENDELAIILCEMFTASVREGNVPDAKVKAKDFHETWRAMGRRLREHVVWVR